MSYRMAGQVKVQISREFAWLLAGNFASFWGDLTGVG